MSAPPGRNTMHLKALSQPYLIWRVHLILVLPPRSYDPQHGGLHQAKLRPTAPQCRPDDERLCWRGVWLPHDLQWRKIHRWGGQVYSIQMYSRTNNREMNCSLGFSWLLTADGVNLNCISSLLISSSKHIGTDMRLLPSDVLLQCILRRRQGERKRGIKETQLRFTHWLVSISPCRELESWFHQEWKEEAHELQDPAGKILAAQDLLPVCRLLCRSTSLRQVLQNVYSFVYKFRSRLRLGFDPSYCFNCSHSI